MAKEQQVSDFQSNADRLTTQRDLDIERLSRVERLLARSYTEDKHNMSKHERELLQAERVELVRRVRGRR